MRDQDATFAFVVDHQGRVVYHPDSESMGLSYPQDLPETSNDVLQAVVPIVIEGIEVGTAVVGLETDFVDEAMQATARGLLMPLGAGTLIGVIGTFWLTGVHVRRIEKLAAAVQALGAGDMLAHVDVGGRNEVSRLANHFNKMVLQLNTAQQEKERGLAQTVSALVAAIEAKDAYTRGHCERVARISCAIAERLGVDDTELRELDLAAMLHDIGKIGIGEKTIGKAGRLNTTERQSMQQHPEIGARILSPLTFLGNVENYVRHHHEHYDGSGYPDGLTGQDIPLASRIIHLVDAYDAMTSSRSYRAALDHEVAIARIVDGRNRQFDPRLVDLFLQLDQAGIVRAICEDVVEEVGAA
jgi:putative nucleotidyltransferase with HDIG domain